MILTILFCKHAVSLYVLMQLFPILGCNRIYGVILLLILWWFFYISLSLWTILKTMKQYTTKPCALFMGHADGLMQNCITSIAKTLGKLQSCLKPSILWSWFACYLFWHRLCKHAHQFRVSPFSKLSVLVEIVIKQVLLIVLVNIERLVQDCSNPSV